jgi:RNA polymerase subunit RPABC4/transcription elongation factor Spt4
MDSLTEVVSGNLAKALEEADKLLRSPRTRVEIITLRRQMKTVTSELGRRTLQLYKDGRIEDPELAELCARIISIEARIAEREARLAQVQAQTDRQSDDTGPAAEECSRCSTVLPEEAVFCHKCGLKLETAAPVPTPRGRFCAQCGRTLRPEAGFCPRCGTAA